MGCLLSCFGNSSGQARLNEETDEPKVYSWDKRDDSKFQDLTVENIKDSTVLKMPGSYNGEEIVIKNCENSNIYIFDHIAQVSIDDCINCRMFIGPSQGSVFIRDCKQCKFVLACQQFRTRDCFQIDTFLLCGTQPIIESSSRMKFGCFRYNYAGLESHLRMAGLSVFNNNWSNLHDFTPVPGEGANFSLLPQDVKVEDFVPVPEGEEVSSLQITTSEDDCIVPQTWGSSNKISYESCLVVFFSDGDSSSRAATFIKKLRQSHPDCIVIQSKELTMNQDDSKRVFQSEAYVDVVTQGSVIGFEINGQNCVQLCHALIREHLSDVQHVFISKSAEDSQMHIEGFFTFADMQMSI